MERYLARESVMPIIQGIESSSKDGTSVVYLWYKERSRDTNRFNTDMITQVPAWQAIILL